MCTAYLLLSSCSTKEHGLDKALIKGTWKGTASYKQISKVKTYAPSLEDSLTKLVDSTIIIQDVVLDVTKEEIQLYGFKNVSSTPYTYDWDENHLTFQKGVPAELINDSTVSVLNLFRHPSANILKIDDDSLVLQLAIYKDGWHEYLLKLKRK